MLSLELPFFSYSPTLFQTQALSLHVIFYVLHPTLPTPHARHLGFVLPLCCNMI